MTIAFADGEVSYERFVNDVAQRIVEKLSSQPKQDFISQNEAYRRYGRANVDRWLRQGKVHPRKRPGKMEYIIAELDRAQTVQQDYFSQ